MTNKLFNSAFENSLRILLLLAEFDCGQSLDKIYATDFMVSYGATFGVSESDLNGDNQYKFSEFASRREFVRQALKQLVLDGLVWPYNSPAGILYSITDAGREYGATLDSEYAEEYRSTARKIVKIVLEVPERSIIEKINKMSAESLKKGARE
jgi:hypothetical protein